MNKLIFAAAVVLLLAGAAVARMCETTCRDLGNGTVVCETICF
jgi:hypothetical protein